MPTVQSKELTNVTQFCQASPMSALLPLNEAQFELKQVPRLCKSAQLHGHLLMRRLLTPDVLAPLQAQIAHHIVHLGWAQLDQAGRPQAQVHKQLQSQGFDDPQWLGLMQSLLGSAQLHALLRHPNLQKLLQDLLSTREAVQYGAIVRAMFPASAHQTPPHQEQFYLPNAKNLWNVWLPLFEIGLQDGAIALAQASNQGGLLTHVMGENGFPSVPLVERTQWLASPMQPGDALLFQGLMLHRSLPNDGPWLRLSLDVRCGTA